MYGSTSWAAPLICFGSPPISNLKLYGTTAAADNVFLSNHTCLVSRGLFNQGGLCFSLCFRRVNEPGYLIKFGFNYSFDYKDGLDKVLVNPIQPEGCYDFDSVLF